MADEPFDRGRVGIRPALLFAGASFLCGALIGVVYLQTVTLVELVVEHPLVDRSPGPHPLDLMPLVWTLLAALAWGLLCGIAFPVIRRLLRSQAGAWPALAWVFVLAVCANAVAFAMYDVVMTDLHLRRWLMDNASDAINAVVGWVVLGCLVSPTLVASYFVLRRRTRREAR